MNKYLITGIVFSSMLTASSLALAGQPSPNAAEGRDNAGQGKNNAKKPSPKAKNRSSDKRQNAGSNPKVQIAHCGCNYDGSGLEWKHIRVSTKARGHLKHTADSDARCINDMDEEVMYTRGFDDCRTSDEPSNNLGGLARCDNPEDIEDPEDLVDTMPVVGDSCEVVEEPVETDV